MAYSKECLSIEQYLRDRNIAFNNPSPNQINGGTPGVTHAPGSYHYRPGTGANGRAVDITGPSLSTIYNAFVPAAAKLAELIFVGPNITQNVKNGKWVPIYDHAANAKTHVHVAVELGVFLATTPPANIQEASMAINKPAVAILSTNDGKGYWIVAADGGVFTFGDAPFDGSEGGRNLAAPIVDATVTPDGLGMWLLGADGGVFTEGKASFYGAATDKIH